MISRAVDPPMVKRRLVSVEDRRAGSLLVAIDLEKCASVGRSLARQVIITVRACLGVHTATVVEDEATARKVPLEGKA